MKKIMLIMAMAMTFVACHKETISWSGEEGEESNIGYLAFGEGGLSVNLDSESADGDINPMATRAQVVEAGANYMIEIWKADGSQMVTSFKYGNRESEYTTSAMDPSRRGLALETGRYIVKAYSAPTPAVSTTPEYAGQATVEVTKERVANVSITCRLSSVKVSVRFDPILASLITDATTSRMVLGGEGSESTHTFTGRPVTPEAADNAVTEGLSKMKWDATDGYRYLRPDGEVNPLTLFLTTTYNGSAIKDQALKVCDNAKAGEWRKITVKLDNGDSGTVYFTVEVQTWVNGEEVDCDVTRIAMNLKESAIPDETDAPEIEWEDHDLALPFTITDAMFDSKGKFTDGASFIVNSRAEITSLKLKVTSTNADLTEAVNNVGLNAEAGLDITDSGLSAIAKMIIGNWGFPLKDVVGSKRLTFDLSPLMETLHKEYAGNHSFYITVIDSNNSTSTSKLDITSGIVIDPNIVWVGYNIDQRYDITPDDTTTQMKILVTAKSGIKSLVVTIEGPLVDKGLLTDVGMPSSFDLVDPGKKLDGSDLAVNLNGMGFPTGDGVRNKTSISFDITSFKPMLKVAPGETNFKLTLTDNDGNTIEKSMMINMIVK